MAPRGRQNLLTCQRCDSIHVECQAFVDLLTNTLIKVDTCNVFCEKCDGVAQGTYRKCTKAEIKKAKILRAKNLKQVLAEVEKELSLTEE